MPSAAEGAVFRRGFLAAMLAGFLGTRLEMTPVLAVFGFAFDVVDFVMVFVPL
jgi:hypothetical protein